MPTPETLNLVVLDKQVVAEGVVRLTLGPHDNGALPAWQPGAHIDLHLGQDPTLVRQYSLCSSPDHCDHYEVAVLREPESRGGSSYIADRLQPGDTVTGSAPRNHFRLVPSPRYVFVAGGIGITPILPMLAAADAAGADWTLLYGGRTHDSMAFADELLERWGSQVSVRPQDVHGLLDLTSLLGSPAPDTAIYCCGPAPLIDAVEAICASWPSGALHTERFSAVGGNTAGSDDHEDTEFEVEFARSAVTLTVPAGQSIMEVAEEAGIPILYSCEEGTCGSCELTVLSGEPEHRDYVLTEDERQAGKTMMICVSRAKSLRLTLDA